MGELMKGALMPITMGQATDVVHVQNVDSSQAQSLQTRLPRFHHAIETVVIDRLKRQWGIKAPTLGIGAHTRIRLHQPTDLGREYEIIGAAQHIPEAPLAEPETIVGCGVEIADACLERR